MTTGEFIDRYKGRAGDCSFDQDVIYVSSALELANLIKAQEQEKAIEAFRNYCFLSIYMCGSYSDIQHKEYDEIACKARVSRGACDIINNYKKFLKDE